MLINKTLSGKNKEGKEDGMNLKDNIGRNASARGAQACPPHLSLINPVKSFLAYIIYKRVIESTE